MVVLPSQGSFHWGICDGERVRGCGGVGKDGGFLEFLHLTLGCFDVYLSLAPEGLLKSQMGVEGSVLDLQADFMLCPRVRWWR